MSQVLKIEDILHASSVKVTKNTNKKNKQKLPVGRPRSGRVWKSEKQRFKSMVKTRGLQKANSFKKQMKLKEDLTRIKTISRAREKDRTTEKEMKKQRRRDNLEREKHKALQAEVVQVIKNPNKIKKISRKQLRTIEKRDTLKAV